MLTRLAELHLEMTEDGRMRMVGALGKVRIVINRLPDHRSGDRRYALSAETPDPPKVAAKPKPKPRPARPKRARAPRGGLGSNGGFPFSDKLDDIFPGAGK